MNARSFLSSWLQVKPVEGRNVVVDWAESLATFCDYYHQVAACLQENKGRPIAGDHLSIYSQATLVALLTSMQAELHLLCQDIDRLPSYLADSERLFIKKLATHKKYLTQLNQQAFLLLRGHFPN